MTSVHNCGSSSDFQLVVAEVVRKLEVLTKSCSQSDEIIVSLNLALDTLSCKWSSLETTIKVWRSIIPIFKSYPRCAEMELVQRAVLLLVAELCSFPLTGTDESERLLQIFFLEKLSFFLVFFGKNFNDELYCTTWQSLLKNFSLEESSTGRRVADILKRVLSSGDGLHLTRISAFVFPVARTRSWEAAQITGLFWLVILVIRNAGDYSISTSLTILPVRVISLLTTSRATVEDMLETYVEELSSSTGLLHSSTLVAMVSLACCGNSAECENMTVAFCSMLRKCSPHTAQQIVRWLIQSTLLGPLLEGRSLPMRQCRSVGVLLRATCKVADAACLDVLLEGYLTAFQRCHLREIPARSPSAALVETVLATMPIAVFQGASYRKVQVAFDISVEELALGDSRIAVDATCLSERPLGVYVSLVWAYLDDAAMTGMAFEVQGFVKNTQAGTAVIKWIVALTQHVNDLLPLCSTDGQYTCQLLLSVRALYSLARLFRAHHAPKPVQRHLLGAAQALAVAAISLCPIASSTNLADDLWVDCVAAIQAICCVFHSISHPQFDRSNNTVIGAILEVVCQTMKYGRDIGVVEILALKSEILCSANALKLVGGTWDRKIDDNFEY